MVCDHGRGWPSTHLRLLSFDGQINLKHEQISPFCSLNRVLAPSLSPSTPSSLTTVSPGITQITQLTDHHDYHRPSLVNT